MTMIKIIMERIPSKASYQHENSALLRSLSASHNERNPWPVQELAAIIPMYVGT